MKGIANKTGKMVHPNSLAIIHWATDNVKNRNPLMKIGMFFPA